MNVPAAEALKWEAFELQGRGAHADAVPLLERARSIAPDDAVLHNQLGISLNALRRLEDAFAAFDRAVLLDPQLAAAKMNRGNVLQDLGRYREALQDYASVLRDAPDDPMVHWNFALLSLRLGDFERGWREFEWRRHVDGFTRRPRALPLPMPAWDLKSSVAGRTVMVHAEQGYGDALQFCRYVPWLAAQGARVVLEAFGPLARLLERLPGVSAVVSTGAPLPAADFHCPLMSLPLAAQLHGYRVAVGGRYLAADPRRVSRWGETLAAIPRPRIGIAWSGNPRHIADAQRTLPFRRMLEAVPAGMTCVSLQKEVRPGDLEALRSSAVLDFSSDLRDFEETAALCESLDRVVCVDTSVAHLAGALGKPVDLLLPFNPDWRWGIGSERTDWYPSMRLWRQPRDGAWDEPLAALRADLESMGRRDASRR